MTSPWVRRTWAPRGQTPELVQRTSRQKASAIGALAISPRRVKVRLLFSLRPSENVTAAWVVDFLRDLLRDLGPRVLVVWDNLNAHRAQVVRQAAARHRFVRLEPLPPYAPELNPVERVWLYLRERFLSLRVFTDYRALVDACCQAWNRLVAEPGRLRSLRDQPWLRKVSS